VRCSAIPLDVLCSSAGSRSSEFGTVVGHDHPRFAAPCNEGCELAGNPSAGDRDVGAKLGELVSGVRCEDLEHLTFTDATFDIHTTQDVMEHVFSSVFTTPLVNKHQPSSRRATIDNGKITYLAPPEYHGSAISEKGSLVTWHWGFDITRQIFEASGLFSHLNYIDDLSKGIRAELIEVLVTLK
jgi:hypothetical protein